MIRFIIAVLLFMSLGTVQQLRAQPQQQIDSLLLKMEEAVDSFDKGNYAYQVGYAYMSTEPEKGLAYTKLALALTPRDSVVALAQNYNMVGVTYAQLFSKDSMDVAIEYFKEALRIFKNNGLTKHVGNSHLNIAQAYMLIKNIELALENLYKAQEIFESINDTQNLGAVYNVLAHINLQQEDYERGLKHAKRYQVILQQQIELDSSVFRDQPNVIPIAWYNLGLAYLKVRSLDSAAYYLKQSLKYFEALEYKNFIAKASNSLADVYIFKEELEKARPYLQRAIELEGHFNSKKKRLHVKNSLANLYHYSKEYDKSIVLHQEILEVSEEENYLDMQLMALQALSESYQEKGAYQKAYEMLRLALPLKDSVFNTDREQVIEDLEVKYATEYETEKKERENIMLNQELDIQTLKATNREQMIYGILGLLFLIIVIFILVIRQNRLEGTRRMQQLNYRLLLNQMSPHFIFNALTAIQSFVYRNDPRKAGKYLSSFAKLMRAILENSRTEYIPLVKELKWLDNYLHLQALRFNNKFEYKVEVDEELDIDGVLLPPMLTQPFIENAIEHGIKELEIQGLLTIQFKLEEEQLVVYITDNGVGFDTSNPKKSDHVSLATKITKERLSFLNQGNNHKIDFNIASAPNAGTTVFFSIPVQYN
ncbi:MAG: histidine kinase [Aureispira sp.]